jgi:hypothetical protein
VNGLDACGSDLDSLGFALGVCVSVDFGQTLSVGVVFAYARVDGMAVTAAARALLSGCAVGGVAIDRLALAVRRLGCREAVARRKGGSGIFTGTFLAPVGASIRVISAVALI